MEVENIIRSSNLPWLILCLGVVAPLKLSFKLDPIMYEIQLAQRIEFLYTKDAGTAFANAATLDIKSKILQLGEGKSCQIYQRTFAEKMLEIMGIPMLSESAFKMPKNDSDWFYTGLDGYKRITEVT